MDSRSRSIRGACAVVVLALLLLVSFGRAESLDHRTVQPDHEHSVGLITPGPAGKRLNILMVSYHMNGHLMPLISLGEELKSRGHSVTIAAQRLEGDTNPRKVVTEAGLRYFEAGVQHMTKQEIEELLLNMARNPTDFLDAFRSLARVEVDVYQVLDAAFSSGEKGFGDVDVIVEDGLLESGVWLAHKYGLPVVLNDPFSFAAKVPASLTHPNYPSGFDDRMPFLKRVGNSIFFAVGWALTVYKNGLVRKLVKERGIVEPSGYRFLSASIGGRYVSEPVLANTIPGLEFPTEAGPNLFFVGPLVSSTIQPVPEDISQWLEDRRSRRDPTVLVSFGSSAYLDDTQGQTFLRGLIDAGVHAIWPSRPTNRGFFKGIDVPERIRVEEWVPQQAILNHSAVSGYVGHCGTGGTHQTLAFGKPVVCIPFMADHFETAARVYASGAGRRIHLSVLTKGDLHTVSETITSILAQGNPYQTAAERVAGMMKAYGGVKTAANVVEYVAAFGYNHLKIARWELGWLARHSVDVLAFWGAVLGGFLVLGALVVRRLLRVVMSVQKQKAA